MTKATDLIAAERERQITEEGYTTEHDAGQGLALMAAANCYRMSAARAVAGMPIMGFATARAHGWPWAKKYWKPTGDPVRDLTKSGALAAAAIDTFACSNPRCPLPRAHSGRPCRDSSAEPHRQEPTKDAE